MPAKGLSALLLMNSPAYAPLDRKCPSGALSAKSTVVLSIISSDEDQKHYHTAELDEGTIQGLGLERSERRVRRRITMNTLTLVLTSS